MSENKVVECFDRIVSSKKFLLICCSAVFLLSIFLRSLANIGPDTGVYIDLGREIARGGKYYYNFFESNFPLSFYIYALEYHLSVWSGISPILMSEIFINILALGSICYSAQILKRTTIYDNRAHYNLIIISYFIGFFIRADALELSEFGTKSSFLMICFFPYLSYSFERTQKFTKNDLIQRGLLMGIIPCFKPHYIFLIVFIELYKFWKNRQTRGIVKFIFEIDKLVMLLIGVTYLFLMLKLTPEFFEFIVPMWPKVYIAYDDLSVFIKNALVSLGSTIMIHCLIFIAFARLKFTENDRILFLVFCSVSLLIILENIGSIDQTGILYALYLTFFVKITYDLILSGKYRFRDNKFFMITLLAWPLSDMSILPKAIISAGGFINVWWLITLVYPFIFCYNLRKSDKAAFSIFKSRYLTKCKIGAAIFIYGILLIIQICTIRYIGVWGFLVTNIATLFFVLFFFEKFYAKFTNTFSTFAVFAITLSMSCLIYNYLYPLSKAMFDRENLYRKSEDHIKHYVMKYAPKKHETFLVFSTMIPDQFPIMNYLEKENYHLGNVASVISVHGFLGSGNFYPVSKDKDKVLTLSYLFEDIKKQMKNQNVKLLIFNQIFSDIERDKCFVGFLEYYFYDPEFRKIFFENFRFENRILTSKKIKHPFRKINILSKNKDRFADLEPSNELISSDLEVYVRK